MHSAAKPRFFLVHLLAALAANLVLPLHAGPLELTGRKLIEEKVKSLEPKAEEAAYEVARIARQQLVSLESAKDLWALENHKTAGTKVKESDLLPYLGGGGMPVHFPGGEFVINPIGTAPKSTVFGTADSMMDPALSSQNHNAAVRVVLSEAMVQLTMIENAKMQWGLANKKTPGTKVFEADLLPYFLGSQAPVH